MWVIGWVQGKYEKAEPLYQKSLEILEKTLGKDHPDIATNINNLALLYQAQAKYKKSEFFYQQAITIVEKSLGKNHPNAKLYRENYESLLEEVKQI
jgi:tetratricopeptide (TPR) repeat protein